MADNEKLDKALAWVKANPKSWNQEVWAEETECGTRCCFAGAALLTNGYRFVFEGPYGPRFAGAMSPSGERIMSIQEEAQKILELNPQQANRLFDGLNDLDELTEAVALIKGGDDFGYYDDDIEDDIEDDYDDDDLNSGVDIWG